MCVCVCGFQGVVFPSTFILCLLFWSLVMWLKSINHQSNSLGSLTHELRGRSRGGKCQESFQWTLSISCSDWERKAGSLPSEVLGFWGFVWVVWYLWAPSSPLESPLISEVEEVWDQLPTSVSKSKVRLCQWSRVWIRVFPERHQRKGLRIWPCRIFIRGQTGLSFSLITG